MDQNGSGLAVVSSLDDPVRRSLYEFVSGSAEPVGRDAAAAAVGSAGRWRRITWTSWSDWAC